MGTRSHVGRINKDGTVDYVYVHWDGDPITRIPILLEYDAAKIDQLILLGFVSSIDVEIGEKHDFDDYELARKNKWTTFYERDRGEEDVIFKHLGSFEEYAAELQDDIFIEYVYLLLPSGSIVWSPGSKNLIQNIKDWHDVSLADLNRLKA